jgi:UV excision repair protein RAD23
MDLSALAGNPQLEQLRQMVQANPQLIQPIIQQMAGSNPQLMQLIQSNPEAFLSMLMGGAAPEGEGDEDDESQLPPGFQTIHVTEAEKAAIDRLVALGFDRNIAVEAYLACDKNEELAANYLFENQFE